jgi:citronellol/citronellal dehydrogenase
VSVRNIAARRRSGNFHIDERVLAAHGVNNFESYSLVPGSKQLYPDLFL